MQPANGLLLVRPVETDATRPGGRILLISETRERMTANQCEVIARGADAVCEDEECERVHGAAGLRCEPNEYGGFDDIEILVHPCPVRVGDWLLVRPRSYIAGPDPEKAEWFIAHDDVLAILNED